MSKFKPASHGRLSGTRSGGGLRPGLPGGPAGQVGASFHLSSSHTWIPITVSHPIHLFPHPSLFIFMYPSFVFPTHIFFIPPVKYMHLTGRFLSGGIILGSPLSYSDLFLYTITLPLVSREAPPTLSYTSLEMT